VALPLYFVARVGRTDIGDLGQLVVMPVAAAVVVVVGLLLSHAVFAALPFAGASRRAGIALAAFGNAGYIPLTLAEILPASVPAVAARYSPEIVPVQIAAFLFVFSPLLWSLGSMIITSPDDGRSRFQWTKLVSPPLIGIVIGLAVSLTGIGTHAANPQLPFRHILEAIDRLAAITLPLALVCLGALIGGLKVPRGAFGHYHLRRTLR
jgi:malate permease and related proteins